MNNRNTFSPKTVGFLFTLAVLIFVSVNCSKKIEYVETTSLIDASGEIPASLTNFHEDKDFLYFSGAYAMPVNNAKTFLALSAEDITCLIEFDNVEATTNTTAFPNGAIRVDTPVYSFFVKVGRDEVKYARFYKIFLYTKTESREYKTGMNKDICFIREIDKSLEFYDPGMNRNLESFQQTKDEVTIYGWAFVGGWDSTRDYIFVGLDSAKHRYQVPVNRMPRGDVAAHVKRTLHANYDATMCGFHTTFPLKALAEGTYTVCYYIVAKEDDFFSFLVESGQTFSYHPSKETNQDSLSEVEK